MGARPWIAALLLWASLAAAVQPPCYPEFVGVNPSSQARRAEAAYHAYAELLAAQMKRESAVLVAEIREANRRGEPYVVDDLGVGAGPLNAVAFANLRATDPRGRRLILEAGDHLGVFHKLPDFVTNTVELPGDSWNVLPGMPVQPRDLNATGLKFVRSSVFGDATVLGHYHAQSNVAFGQRVSRISEQPREGAWPARYKVETADGLVVYTNRVFLSTGLGDPAVRLQDPASLALVSAEKARFDAAVRSGDREHAAGLITVDDFLALASQDAQQGRKPLERYGTGKRFAVIGSFDGGRIALERLIADNATDQKILWVGQKARTGAEFREILKGNKIERYGPIADKWDQLDIAPGHLSKVEKIEVEGKVKWRLTYGEPDQPSRTEIVDHVVFATGYSNTAMGLVEGLGTPGTPTRLEPIVMDRQDYSGFRFTDPNTIVGARVMVGDKPHEIYALGGASGIAQNPEERARGFMGTAGPAVAALTNQLGHQSAARGNRRPTLLTGVEPVRTTRPASPPAPAPRTTHDSLPVTLVDLKLRFGDTFSRFELPGRTQLRIAFRKREGRLEFTYEGLDAAAADKLHEEIRENTVLMRLADDAFRLGKSEIVLTLPTRGNGSPRLEDMQITAE